MEGLILLQGSFMGFYELKFIFILTINQPLPSKARRRVYKKKKYWSFRSVPLWPKVKFDFVKFALSSWAAASRSHGAKRETRIENAPVNGLPHLKKNTHDREANDAASTVVWVLSQQQHSGGSTLTHFKMHSKNSFNPVQISTDESLIVVFFFFLLFSSLLNNKL